MNREELSWMTERPRPLRMGSQSLGVGDQI